MFDDVFLTICFFIMCLFWTCRRCALAWCPSACRGPSSPALSAWSPTTCSCGRCSRWWTRRGTVASRSATSSTRSSSSPRAAARIRLGSYRGISRFPPSDENFKCRICRFFFSPVAWEPISQYPSLRFKAFLKAWSFPQLQVCVILSTQSLGMKVSSKTVFQTPSISSGSGFDSLLWG